MPRRSTLQVIGGTGIAFALLSELVQLKAGSNPERLLVEFFVGVTFLVAGLVAWARQPENATWKVMAGLGVAWFVGNYAAVPIGAVSSVASLLADLDSILLVALVLIYPTGRLDDRLNRLAVVVNAIGLTILNGWFVLTGDASANLVFGLCMVVTVSILSCRRWLMASPELRRQLGPAMFATLVMLLAIGIAIVVRLLAVQGETLNVLLAIRDLSVLAVPVGFVVGIIQIGEDELRRSRARLVEAADEERRHLERDLHDGAQQRLVSVSIALRLLRARLGPSIAPDVAETLDEATEELKAGIADLRELARGIHPAVLTESGLPGALAALAGRSAVPTRVVVFPDRRLPPPVEATAYFVASEALTNVAKYAAASSALIRAEVRGGRLRLEVSDDGVGGASIDRGTGLRGLADRVAALGGDLRVDSPLGRGTRVIASIPVPDAEPRTRDNPVVLTSEST